VTHVQETCIRNLYTLTCTRNLHVCHSDLQQNFSCESFLHSRASFLHKIEHVLFYVLVEETCIKNLMYLYKFLVCLSSALGFKVTV